MADIQISLPCVSVLVTTAGQPAATYVAQELASWFPCCVFTVSLMASVCCSVVERDHWKSISEPSESIHLISGPLLLLWTLNEHCCDWNKDTE